MTDEIKLGELAFDAESFKQIIKSNGFCSESVIAVYSQELANVANRILREKLAKAPLMELDKVTKRPSGQEIFRETYGNPDHTARLVCIEKL